LIRREFDIGLTVRGVGEYVVRWGYTPQKAARRAYERDDAAAQDGLSIGYPKTKARAKRENAEISWDDETGVRSEMRVSIAATHRRARRRSSRFPHVVKACRRLRR